MTSNLADLLIAANVGIMVFFTVAVAPTIFTALPPQWSAAYVRKFFPRYFLFLGVTTVAALGFAVQLDHSKAHQWALLGCALIFFLNCFWLTPRINKARDDGEDATFKVLHWASVSLNMLQLVAFIWMLVPTGSSM
jgi:FtsH-binding integral membrane protein